MEQSRTYNSVRNIIWACIQKFAMILFPFFVRSVMISRLGEEYTGLSSLFTSILTMLSLAELGFSSAMVYCMYEPIHNGDTKTICALLNLYKKIYACIGTIILALGLCLLPFLPNLISGDVPEGINIYILYLMYLANTVVSYFMFAYKSSLMTAYQRNDIISKVTTVAHIVLYTLQIILLCAFKSFYLYAIIIPVTTALMNLSYEIISRKLYPEIRCAGSVTKEMRDKIKKRVVGMMLYKFSSTTRTSFDSVIVSMFLGLVLLARYQNYFYIVSSVTGVLSVVQTSVTASVGDSIISKPVDETYKDFKKFVFIYMWIGGWFAICIGCLIQPFMTFWMGESMLLPLNIVLILSIYFYAQTMGDMVYLYRTAAGLWWEDRIRPVVEAVLNILLNLLLVQFMGLFGIVLATVLTLVFVNFFWGGKILFKNYFKRSMREYMSMQGINAIITVSAAALTYYLCSLTPFSGFRNMLLRIPICIIVPNLIMWICYRRSNIYASAKPFVVNIANIFFKRIKR